jgi:RNA polymerase sigma-70 factor (ECF subfamily)
MAVSHDLRGGRRSTGSTWPAPRAASGPRRSAARDRAAFAELWRRHVAEVRELLRRLLGQDVEDAVQEVALAAWRGLPAPYAAPDFAACLRDHSLAVARATKRVRRLEAAPLPGDFWRPAPRDALGEILAQVRALPGCYRRPLWLRLTRHLSGPQIAARVGMTQGSVRVNLHRGMKLLRRRLLARGEAATPPSNASRDPS